MVVSSVGLEPRACLGGMNGDEAKETDRKLRDVAEPMKRDERLKRHKTWDEEGAIESGSSTGPYKMGKLANFLLPNIPNI